MSMRPRRSESDPNQLAAQIVPEATDILPPASHEKNPTAVALGRLGGKKGGPARAKNLSVAKRRTIARKAAAARWSMVGREMSFYH